MRKFFRRETIIALRARRQAYRIASEIANPPLKVDAPSQDSKPSEEYFSKWTARVGLQSAEQSSIFVRLFEFGVLYALLLIVLWVIFNPRW